MSMMQQFLSLAIDASCPDQLLKMLNSENQNKASQRVSVVLCLKNDSHYKTY